MGKFVPVKKGKLNCLVEGFGDPVIFLHGFPLDNRMWQPQVDFLISRGFQVIRYDLRGFGYSSLPEENRSYSHIDDLAEIISSNGLNDVHLVGASFGGEVAINYALEIGLKIKSLTLLAPSVGGTGLDPESPLDDWKQMAQDGKINEVKDLIKNHRSAQNLPDNQKRVFETMINDYSMWHFLHNDRRVTHSSNERLGGIIVPVLLLIGKNDSKWNRSVASMIESEVQNVTRIDIKNASHLLNLESPEKINEEMLNFFENLNK